MALVDAIANVVSALADADLFYVGDNTGVGTYQDGQVSALAIRNYVLTGPLAVIGSSAAGAQIRLPEDTDNGSNYVALKAPDSLAANITFTLPSADGTNGQALVTNGSGALSWGSFSAATPFSVTGNATAGAEIRLPEDTDNGSNYVALKAPDTLASNITFTLPSADGTNGQALVTNGSGALSWATISGGSASAPLTLDSGTITSDSNALTITQTWNNSGVTFSGALKLNVTETAANASSLLMDLQRGGSSKFSVRRDARLTLTGESSVPATIVGNSQFRTGCVTIGYDGIGGSATVFGDGSVSTYYGGVGADGVGTGDNRAFGFLGTIGSQFNTKFIRVTTAVIGVRGSGNSTPAALNLTPYTVSGLPSASTATAGSLAVVSDANATTPRSTVAGDGANKVLVMSDGTNWIIVA